MRFAAAIAITIMLFVPSAGVAQEAAPAVVEAAQSPSAGLGLCTEPADKRVCVAAISGAAVAAVIAANAVTGGALTPVLMAGNGGLSAAVVALIVAHLGLDVVLITTGSAAAVVTGVTDPVIAAAGDAYAAAQSYAAAAANGVSTAASDAGAALGDWLNGR